MATGLCDLAAKCYPRMLGLRLVVHRHKTLSSVSDKPDKSYGWVRLNLVDSIVLNMQRTKRGDVQSGPCSVTICSSAVGIGVRSKSSWGLERKKDCMLPQDI